MQTTRSLAVAAALSLLLAGCATKPEQTPQTSATRPSAAAPRGSAQLAPPADYVRRAASIDLFLVRASELALQRSSDPRTRALAQTMLGEHRGLASQLSFAGRRLNLLPGAALLPDQQAWMASLEGSRPFEAGFQRRLALAHQEALVMHGAYARAGASPTLRPVAANAERTERRHLAELSRR